jgi:DNA mismatch repair ATPase MutS
MSQKKILVLLAALALCATSHARAPKPETLATLKNMLSTDAYMSLGKSLAPNATKEQRDAVKLSRSTLTRTVIDRLCQGLPDSRKRKPSEMIFPESLLRDASFFSDDRENTVFSHIDMTFTHAGQVTLAATLAEGCTEINVLNQRANVVKGFALGTEELRKNVKKHIAEFAKHESDLLTRWSSTEAESISKELAAAEKPKGFWSRAWLGAQSYGWGSLEFALKWPARAISFIAWFSLVTKQHYTVSSRQGLNTTTPEKLAITLGAIAAVYTANQFADHAHRKNNKQLSQESILKKTLSGFDELIKAVQAIEKEYALHARPEQTPESLKKVSAVLDVVLEMQKEIHSLLKAGATTAAAQTLEKNLERLTTLLSFVGEIDASLSMARHYRAHRNTRNKGEELVTVSFSTFNTTSKTPYINAEAYWNPIIDYKHAITNSIELGAPGEHKNIVITGPNAGGKSMAMRGLINQLILSHAYQMAWAENFESSIFKLVIGQLTNVDDPSAGKSKLQTEVISMRSILERINKLSFEKGEFALVVTDELFTGTEGDIATDISLELSQVFAEQPHVMYVLATHYKKLTNLEHITNGIFKNYHVEAYITEDSRGNTVTYPYKIYPGIGEVNVALDIILLQMKNYKMNNDLFYARLQALQARLKAKRAAELYAIPTAPPVGA